MNIHLLMFDDRVERASCDGKKIKQLADESNGYDEAGCVLMGPYFAIEIELEDLPESMMDPNIQRINNIGEYNPECVCYKKGQTSAHFPCPVHD